MRKAVAAIRRRNTLSAVPLAIQKPAGQANNPAYRRLKCFFVLTKGMSVVGPRPMILAEYDQIQARDRYGANDIRPGLTGWAQVNGRDGVTVEEKARLDGWCFALSFVLTVGIVLKRMRRVYEIVAVHRRNPR